MSAKKLLTLLLAALLVLSLAACGKKGNDDMTTSNSEPKNAQEAAAMYKALMDQENAILMENQSLWEKVFMSADKGMTMQEDGKNYGDFLLDTIESAKDKFTADELKLLRQGTAEGHLSLLFHGGRASLISAVLGSCNLVCILYYKATDLQNQQNNHFL